MNFFMETKNAFSIFITLIKATVNFFVVGGEGGGGVWNLGI